MALNNKKIITTQFLTNWIKTLFIEQLSAIPVWLKDVIKPTPDTVLYSEEKGAEKKNIYSLLNIEWHDGQKNLEPSSDWMESMRATLKQSFASVEASSEDVEFSPDIDYKVISADVEFLTSASHLQHLDYAMQFIKSVFKGVAVNKNINGSDYTVFFNFGTLISGDTISNGISPESVKSNVSVDISIMPAIATYSDYNVSLSFDGGTTYLNVPLNTFSISKVGNQKQVPFIKARFTSAINLNMVTMWSMSYYDLNFELVRKVNEAMLSDDFDINSPMKLKIECYEKEYIYPVIFQNMGKTLKNGDYVGTEIVLVRAVS